MIHDWLGPMTGAERVLDQILRCYPGADVYTAVDFLPAEHRSFLGQSRVHTSFIQHLPLARTGYWNYVPLMPFAFEQFDLHDYDCIISNSHTVAIGAVACTGQPHVCYLETPMRFAWDLEDYYLDRFRVVAPLRPAVRALLAGMRRWDVGASGRVDSFVAVSQFVARRCEAFYARRADVLYPPVDVDYYTPGDESREDFYLTASRLTPFKQLDVVVRAFNAMPSRRLVVIGDGPERGRIRRLCGPNVTWLGYQPDDVLRSYMRRARAFVFAAPEDFGIVMAEAQACGTPVLALGHGGALEIVRGVDSSEPTGVFFESGSAESIRRAVEELERAGKRITAQTCRANALRFAPARFRDGFRAHVTAVLERRAGGTATRTAGP